MGFVHAVNTLDSVLSSS